MEQAAVHGSRNSAPGPVPPWFRFGYSETPQYFAIFRWRTVSPRQATVPRPGVLSRERISNGLDLAWEKRSLGEGELIRRARHVRCLTVYKVRQFRVYLRQARRGPNRFRWR